MIARRIALAAAAVALVGAADEPPGLLQIPTMDYPVKALRLHQQGLVIVSISVAEDGRPDQCSVQKSSGSPILDEATCNLFMKRARWRPSLDEAGKPVRKAVTERINWRLPG